MAAVSKAHSEDVQEWGGIRVSGVGEDGFPFKREGVVSGDRYCRGVMEGLCNCGSFSAKGKCDLTRRDAWVQ